MTEYTAKSVLAGILMGVLVNLVVSVLFQIAAEPFPWGPLSEDAYWRVLGGAIAGSVFGLILSDEA